MSKITIRETICWSSSHEPWTWGEVKERSVERGFQDDDLIELTYDEEDDNHTLVVERERFETNEEYNARIKLEEKYQRFKDKQDFNLYLELKKKFENGK
jgi:hypothetical protein